jgi:hypothetical protein
LPELVLIEGNEQVVMKPDESLSPFFVHLSLAISRRSPPLVLRFYDSGIFRVAARYSTLRFLLMKAAEVAVRIDPA